MPLKSSEKRLSPRKPASRSSKWAHVGPKVDSRLPTQFMPGESRFQLPKHKRSGARIGEEPPIQEENEHVEEDEDAESQHGEDEDAHQAFESSSLPLHNTPPDSQHTPNYASPAPSSTYSAEIHEQFGGSPAYHNDTDAEQDSRASSRRHSLVLEQPTSNPAQYAKNTDSYRVKMREGVPWQPGSLATSPAVTPEWEKEKKVRFDEPAKPPGRPRAGVRGHDRLRAQSMFTTPTLGGGGGVRKWFGDALDATCQDLLSLRDEFYKERRMLDVRNVLGKRDEMPKDVNGVRERIVEVIACHEAEALQLGKLKTEDERRIGEQEWTIKKLDEALKGKSEDKNREERQDVRMRELETALQRSVENVEWQRRSDVHEEEAQRKYQEMTSRAENLQASLTQKIKELEEAARTHATEVEQLQKELQAKPPHTVSIDQLQEAFILHEDQAQKIRQLEEALQQKTINDALDAGTDTPEWYSLFKRERKVKAAQDTEIAHLKDSITKLNTYHIDLERERDALKVYVATHRDTLRTLQDQLATSKREAEQWHSEYTQQKEMLDGRAFAEETALEALREELAHAISTYQALLPSPSHPDAMKISGLLRKLSTQEKHLDESTSRLAVLTREKAALEKEFEKVIDEKKAALEENARLGNSPAPPTRVVYDEGGISELPRPAWNTDDRLFARQTALSSLLAAHANARDRIFREEAIVEKARAWKMGKHYPPASSRDTYKKAIEKSAWERWEGTLWVQDEAGEGEYGEAVSLGLLGERRGGRRTNEWKGRRVGSMGLRSWEEVRK